ncbi:unnamed protein product [Rotaria sp. Silwood1]|nr:unnamed protein product [Rotaria sp. Silwood1]CAF3572048.1 unnamed protein product [Rotaria sp. Silwood1]CAF4868241.1 unnamed protein product [Rotaria sp. Silwood1]
MGCIQFKVKPNASEKSQSKVSHVDIVHDISDDPNMTNISSTVVYRNPLSISTNLVVSSVISDESEDLTSYPESVISETLVKSTQSNNYHNPVNKETSMKSDKATSLNKITIASTSIDSNEPPTSKENISKTQIKNANLLNIPPVDNDIPITSNELYRIYHRINSPSIRSDTVLYRRNTNNRFLSARENEFDTYQESRHNNDNYTESDTSLPNHNSIIRTISTDSEGSVTSQVEPYGSVFICPKHTNFQQKPSSKSDKSELKHEKCDSSAVVDMKVMTKNLVTALKTTSAKLSISGFHHSGAVSETDSDVDEF